LSSCRRLIEIDDGVYELQGDAWKRDGNEMKKKKPRAKSYQEINRALDAALAKCGEPKLTFRKESAQAPGPLKRGGQGKA